MTSRLADAQSYPSRPIMLIVPVSAGGQLDVIGRILAERMRAPLGEPYRATLVAEEALGTDQGQKYLYVVTDKDKVE